MYLIKFLDAIRLNDDYDDDDEFYDDDLDDDDDFEDEKPKKRFFHKLKDDDFDDEDVPVKKKNAEPVKPTVKICTKTTAKTSCESNAYA